MTSTTPTNNDTTEEKPTSSPSFSKTNNRAANWSIAEDEQLCKSWLNVSEDPVTGREQRGKVMWEHIKEDFDKVLPESTGRPERATAGLSSRWNQIRKKVTKYCACVAAALEAANSENRNQDLDSSASSLYYKSTKEVWKMTHCYVILKGAARWEAHLNSSSKEDRESSSAADRPSEDAGGSPGSSTDGLAPTSIDHVPRPASTRRGAKEAERNASKQNLENLLAQILQGQKKIMEAQIVQNELTKKKEEERRKRKVIKEGQSQHFLDLKYMGVNLEEIKDTRRREFFEAMQNEAYERMLAKRPRTVESAAAEEVASEVNEEEDELNSQ